MTDWRFSHWGAGIDGYCARPRVMVNVATGEWYHGRCGSARASRCPSCAEQKRGDISAVGRSGWTDSPRDRGYFVTLTPPGADVLPWDIEVCSHSAGVACSGKIGCRVDRHAMALWHDGLGQRWSWFMTELRRLLDCDVQFFKTWELQQRGGLHCHVMMRVEGVVTERRFRAAVRLAAYRYGFGPQVDVQAVDISDPESAARRAGYCAKYASKSADDLPAVPRLDRSTGELRPVGLRSWSASRKWGDTMASVRERRCQWATMAAGARHPAAAGSLDADDGGGLDSYQGIYAGGAAAVAVDRPSVLL